MTDTATKIIEIKKLLHRFNTTYNKTATLCHRLDIDLYGIYANTKFQTVYVNLVVMLQQPLSKILIAISHELGHILYHNNPIPNRFDMLHQCELEADLFAYCFSGIQSRHNIYILIEACMMYHCEDFIFNDSDSHPAVVRRAAEAGISIDDNLIETIRNNIKR